MWKEKVILSPNVPFLFGKGRLNSGGDRRAIDYTRVGKFVHAWNCHGQNCTDARFSGWELTR